ncbi:GtrA family protein [Amycolatopsis speibonae]|uniref:GtrA family protein n=1 Tax=Amycolatopsis speibonae TaxID=1450224 RepID=A0ABV7P0F6_9PSEU
MLGRHRELLRFAVVGGASFVITMTITYGLKFTVLTDKPVTALMIGVLVATVFSYVANREWSFRFRGGRERAHEATLFFLLSAIALGLNALPQLISRHVLDLEQPHVGLLTQEIADFVSGVVIGTLLGTVFRWWSFKKWVFPEPGARPRLVRGDGPPATDISEDSAA